MPEFKPEFTLYIVSDGPLPLIFRQASEALRKAYGERMQEHTFRLRFPITNKLQSEQERLMFNGAVRDVGLEKAAFLAAFLESWTLTDPLFAEEGMAPVPLPITVSAIEGKLPPNLVQAIYNEASAIAYPNPITSDFFQRFLLKQASGSDTDPGE